MCDVSGLNGWSDEKLERELAARSLVVDLRSRHVRDAEDALVRCLDDGGEEYSHFLHELGEAISERFRASQAYYQVVDESDDRRERRNEENEWYWLEDDDTEW